MIDIQNTKGDYKYKINKVGINNLAYPLKVKNFKGEFINTVSQISMSVSLEKDMKGINMSRLPILLSQFGDDGLVLNDLKLDIERLLKEMLEIMSSRDSYIEIEFDYFKKKKAPVSDYAGFMPYKCKIDSKYSLERKNEFDYVLSIEVPVTTLCPCSKAISAYSAHNQRGYVNVSFRYKDSIIIEDIISIVEEASSCPIYPILKRVDEKYVTERAYENPRFVEDMVRMIADKLMEKEEIQWLSITSRHQESIHAHDAFASLEVSK